MEINFTAPLEDFGKSALGWTHHIKIPSEVFEKLQPIVAENRVVCTLNNSHTFHCAMMPKSGFRFIMINKEIRKKLNLIEDEVVEVLLQPDTTEYGMPMCEEFKEMLLQEPEGESYFKALTNGKKRSLLYVANKPKSSEKRIEKSFVILRHLSIHKGKLDFKILNEEFKRFNRM